MSNTIETKDKDVTAVEYIRHDLRKPKDPNYFRKYYLEKMKGLRYHCELCNCEVANEKKSEHFKSKKHIKNELTRLTPSSGEETTILKTEKGENNKEKPIMQRNSLYSKKYYLEKVKGLRYHCELCNCEVPKENKTRHLKTKKHIRKVSEKIYENYSEFD